MWIRGGRTTLELLHGPLGATLLHFEENDKGMIISELKYKNGFTLVPGKWEKIKKLLFMWF